MGVYTEMAATAVMVLTPTALYVAFWRALMRLRDDDLVTRIDARLAGNQPGVYHGGEAGRVAVGLKTLQPADLDPELDGDLLRSRAARKRFTRCPACGGLNSGGDETCLDCGEEL